MREGEEERRKLKQTLELGVVRGGGGGGLSCRRMCVVVQNHRGILPEPKKVAEAYKD